MMCLLLACLEPTDSLSRRTLDGVILTDISTAQELLAGQAGLTRIDLILPEGDADAALHLEPRLPAGYRVIPAAAGRTRDKMTAGLPCKSFGVELVGTGGRIVLIYNTMTFSVVQRRAYLVRCAVWCYTARSFLVLFW